MIKLLTISASYIDRSTGPIIHYIELWNEFTRLFSDRYDIMGIAYYIDDDTPIIQPSFRYKTFRYLKIPYVRNVLCDLRRSVWLFFNIRKFDIVYTRMEPLSFFSSVVLVCLAKNLVVEHNGTIKKDLESGHRSHFLMLIGEWQERSLARRAAANIAVSPGIASHLGDIKGKNTMVINNGVASAFFEQKQKNNEDSKIRVTYVGTFTPWDGAIYIIKLAKEFSNIDFYLYGDGPQRNKVEESIESNNVFLPGVVEYCDLPNVYGQSDAGIVLYTFERNDMTLSSLKTLEYMASGLPIFSTALPGQEYIADNKIGVNTTLEDLSVNFMYFLDNLNNFKKKVDWFRKNEGRKYSWTVTAIKTESAISLCRQPSVDRT